MIIHSSFQYSYLLLPLIGFAIGLLASMIGGGGGFFFPPALILLFQTPAHIAITTSLAATLPICLAGSLGHYRLGNIDLRTGLIFATGGVIGAIAGACFAGFLSPEQLKYVFGIYLILLSFLIHFNNKPQQPKTKDITNTSLISRLFNKIPKGSFYGFSGGVISGTFGISGTAPVLAGLFAIKLPIKLIAGTSLMIIFVNTASALVSHAFIGKIDLTLVWLLTSGAVLGAVIGPRITKKWKIENKKEGKIKKAYAVVVLALGIIMIVF